MRKQETRKRKKAKRVRKSRRQKQKRSHTKRQRQQKRRQQGGNYAEDFTGKSIDGMPYAKDAVVVAGQDVMKAKDLKRHGEYLDFQGKEQ
jgi:hypothetical protein